MTHSNVIDIFSEYIRAPIASKYDALGPNISSFSSGGRNWSFFDINWSNDHQSAKNSWFIHGKTFQHYITICGLMHKYILFRMLNLEAKTILYLSKIFHLKFSFQIVWCFFYFLFTSNNIKIINIYRIITNSVVVFFMKTHGYIWSFMYPSGVKCSVRQL